MITKKLISLSACALMCSVSISAFAGDAYKCNVYSSNNKQEQKNPVLAAVLIADVTHPTDSATVNGFEVALKLEANESQGGATRAVYSISKNGVKTESGVGPDNEQVTAYESANQIELICFPRTYGR